MNQEQARDILHNLNQGLHEPFRIVNEAVLCNPTFLIAPGSTMKHHAYKYGLIIHTAEVASFCDFTLKQNDSLNRSVLITAAIWHDFGKIYDNKVVSDAPVFVGVMETNHKRLIYHISRSYAEFLMACDRSIRTLSDDSKELVAHCILSHHGHPQYKSPISPLTDEAWALHLADMNSAFCGGTKNYKK